MGDYCEKCLPDFISGPDGDVTLGGKCYPIVSQFKEIKRNIYNFFF